jgi:cytoskeleton protein RodZ
VEAASDNAERGMPETLGATLAAERERQGLSRADAAQRLHMSPTQVEALERGDYASLPRGTFLRGFVRNYAKVLGLEAEPLLAMLAEGAPRDPAPRIVVPTQNIRFDPLGERLSSPYVKAATLAFVAVAIAFAAMYWVMFVRPKPPARQPHEPVAASPAEAVPAPAIPSPPPAQAEPLAGTEPPAAKPAPAVAQPAAPAPDRSAPGKAAGALPAAALSSSTSTSTSTQPARLADAAAKPAKAGSRKAIHFHFAGDSWVEIRDANGKVLFQRLNPAGTDADFAARAPLDVVVGNAPEVRMTLDGADFPLEPHTEVAVARFTLE